MASGGEIGGTLTDNIGSEDLEDVKCQPCQEDGQIREAVGVCTDCQEYLCPRCFDGHKIPKLTRGHQLLNKQEMMQSQIRLTRKDKCTVKCFKHGDRNVKYYCVSHGQLSCSVCLNLDHRVCKGVIYIPDIADDLENNKEYRQVDDHLLSVLAGFDKAAEAAGQNSESLHSSYTGALEAMKAFRKELNNAIDKIEKEIIEKASEMKSTEMKEIVRADELRVQAETELRATLAKLDTFRKRKQNCNLFTEMMTVKTKLDTFDDELKRIEREHSCAKRDIKFMPNTETLDSLRQVGIFGKLSTTRSKGLIQDFCSLRSDTSATCVVKADHYGDIDVKCEDDIEDDSCCITGSVILDNTLILADFKDNKIKTVDLKQSKVSSELTLSSKPWDIAVVNDGQLVVTLPWAKRVVFVKTTESMTVDGTLQLKERCYGIDYKDEKLAITFPDLNQINVIDLKGTVLHIIKPPNKPREPFLNLLYTSFGPDSTTLYVSNNNNHEILCTKLDGTVLGTYTDNNLKQPRKIVVDIYGNVYVCAKDTHTIHQITPDCKKIRVLLTEKDGLHFPYTLSYSEPENKLYVGMDNCNCVKVYNVTIG